MYKHKNGIVLKKLEKSDLLLLKNLKNESWFGTHTINFVNNSDQEKWFDSLNSNKTMMLIAVDSQSNDRIGLYKIQNIDWINRRYDSAHDVFEESRGRGFGKLVLEAGIDFGFEILNVNRIDTEVLENNLASYKNAIYTGFVKEGIKRSCVHKCGQYLDSIFLGILRDDWKNLQRVINYSGVCNLSYTPKNNTNI